MKRFTFIFLSMILAGCSHNNDPKSAYPNTQKFVPAYDRHTRMQFFLDENAIEFKVDPVLDFTAGQEKQVEITGDIKVSGVKGETLVARQVPEWLSVRKSTDKPNTWILSGTAPTTQIVEGINDVSIVTFTLVADPSSEAAALHQLQFYDLEKQVLIRILPQGAKP